MHICTQIPTHMQTFAKSTRPYIFFTLIRSRIDVCDIAMNNKAQVAYLFVTSSDLPKVATTTRIDKFMTLNFVFVFVAMIIHATLYLFREKEDSITSVKFEELKQRKARSADFQSKSSASASVAVGDINLVPIGSSFCFLPLLFFFFFLLPNVQIPYH